MKTNLISYEQPQRQRHTPEKRDRQEDLGPKPKEVERPKMDSELIRRLKNVNPEQAKKYRQRSGQ